MSRVLRLVPLDNRVGKRDTNPETPTDRDRCKVLYCGFPSWSVERTDPPVLVTGHRPLAQQVRRSVQSVWNRAIFAPARRGGGCMPPGGRVVLAGIV